MRSQYSIFRWASEARWLWCRAFLFAPLFPLLLSGCGASIDGGHVVGNGGDEVLSRVHRGRDHARGVLSWLNRSRLERTGGELDLDDEFVLDEHNKERIRQELAEVPVELVSALPSFCTGDAARGVACTLPGAFQTIYALRDRVRAMSVAEIGEILLHEVLHHFMGSDERRVYRLTARLYRGFSDVSTFHLPKGMRQVVPSDKGGAPAIWDGEALLSWNPYRDSAIGRFVPDLGWRKTELKPAPWWISAETKLVPASTNDEVMLYSPEPGTLFAFFTKSGFDQLFGLSIDFDIKVDTRTGEWKTLTGADRAPRWGLVRQLVPSTRVLYAGSKDYFVSACSFEDGAVGVNVFDPKSGKWANHRVNVGGSFQAIRAVIVGGSLRLVGTFDRSSWSTIDAVRIDLSSYALTREGSFRDSQPRMMPTVQAVNGGVVVFGGWVPWRGLRSITRLLDYRNDGAFLPDDSTEWVPLPPNPEAVPSEGNLLILKERDRLHFFGDRWNTFSLGNMRWEDRSKDVGSFFAKMKMVADAGDQMIFWNPIARDGFAIRW